MPALALAEALQQVRPDIEPVLVGATRGVEAHVLPSKSYRFHLLPVEPIHRRRWWRNLRWPLILGELLRAGARVLDEEQPSLAIGTGGYAAGPILFQAAKRGIPLVLQEQNAYPGITTRWLARRAQQIYLGFPEARVHVRQGAHTELCQYGNPIAPPPEPLPEKAEAKLRLGLPSDVPAAFVMGGSQGARTINATVSAAVDGGLLGNVSLLWSTGPSHAQQLGGYASAGHRVVRGFWDPVSEAYAAADAVVARAGAMTTAELCAWGLPTILIPLPTAAGGHQARNAEALARDGAAVHLPESQLDPQRLASEILDLLTEPERAAAMKRSALARGHPKAAENIARHILSLIA